MRSGWVRLGTYVGMVIAVVAVVFVASRNEPRSASLLIGQIGAIGAVAWMLTFLVWPRRRPVSDAHPSRSSRRPGPVPEEAPTSDDRPVVVIGHRAVGSPPASEVHLREQPTVRSSRGRRPGPRRQGEIRWPAAR